MILLLSATLLSLPPTNPLLLDLLHSVISQAEALAWVHQAPPCGTLFHNIGISIFSSLSIACQSLTSKSLRDLIRCRLRVVPEQCVDGHHHPRAAEATLGAVTLGKSFLRDKGTPSVQQAFLSCMLANSAETKLVENNYRRMFVPGGRRLTY